MAKAGQEITKLEDHLVHTRAELKRAKLRLRFAQSVVDAWEASHALAQQKLVAALKKKLPEFR